MNMPLDDLRNTLFHARLYHQGWWCLVGRHKRRDFVVEGVSSHLVFFNAVASSFFDALVSNLATVFDTDKKSISFYSDPSLSNHVLFDEIREKGRKLFVFRNKFVAHRDLLLVANPENFQSGLTHDDLEFVLDRCCQIFDDVARGRGLAPIHEFSCEEDLMNLISTLVN
jgi:hypothetical protein